MANKIVGRIHHIGQTVNVSKKETAFYKRELILNASRFDPYTGEERKNIISLTFAQKNCGKLDDFSKGDLVEVSFVLQGREYTKDGGTKYITDIVGYDVVRKENGGGAKVQEAIRAVAEPAAPTAPQQVSNETEQADGLPF